MAGERCESCGATVNVVQAVDGHWWCILPSGCKRRTNQRKAIARAEAAAAREAKPYQFTRAELEAFAFRIMLLTPAARKEPDWMRELPWYIWRLTDIALWEAKLAPDPGVVTGPGDFSPTEQGTRE